MSVINVHVEISPESLNLTRKSRFRPWLNSDREGVISLLYMDRLLMFFFYHFYTDFCCNVKSP